MPADFQAAREPTWPPGAGANWNSLVSPPVIICLPSGFSFGVKFMLCGASQVAQW